MKKREYKKLFYAFLVIFSIILVFTFIDFLVHNFDKYSVPQRYFTNKIIFGTIAGFITYLFIKNQKPFLKALIFSLIVGILLQIRYFLEGYPLNFILIFLAVHFIILLLISYIAFRYIKI